MFLLRVLIPQEYARIRENVIKYSCMFSRIPYVTFLTLFLRILACSLFRSRVFSRVLLQREYARIRGNIIKCSCVFSRIPYVTFLTLHYVFHHLPETRSKRSRFCQKVAAGGGSRFSTVQGPARGVCPHVFYKFQRSVEKAFFESQSLSRVLSVNHVAKENTRAKHCVGKSLACEALHVHAIQLICVK